MAYKTLCHFLDDELQSADITRRLWSAPDRPPHLHKCGDSNRNVEHRKIAAHESVDLERARAQNAHPAIAEIVDASVKFLGNRAHRLPRQQAPRMHLQHLRKTLMLAALLICGLHCSMIMTHPTRFVNSAIELIRN